MEQSKSVSATMVTTSSLDLNLNKEDLIDIILDEQLTVREEEVKRIKTDLQGNEDKYSKQLIKEVLEFVKPYLPKGFKINNWTVEGVYTNQISLSNPDKVFITYQINSFKASPELEKLKKEKNEKYQKLSHRKAELETEIYNIEKSPKRLKARLLKEFLKGNTEGKQILALIAKKEVSLLPMS